MENIKDRAFKVVVSTMDMTWGFHEYLTDVFNDFYPDYYEEEDDSKKDSGVNDNQLSQI